MNRHYLITLTPMDWFFFGGERTLKECRLYIAFK